MTDAIVNILASVGVSGAVVSVLLWFTKSWISERLKNAIKHEYDEKLEAHKAALKAEHDTALEKLRADLRISAHEREVTFTGLHEKRAETVAETYARLQELFARVANYVKILESSSDPPHSKRREAVEAALREFGEYYPGRAIFLPAKTEVRVKEFHKTLLRIARKFARGVEGGRDEKTGRDSWDETFEEMENEAEPLFEELKAEFRRLLGDDLNTPGGETG